MGRGIISRKLVSGAAALIVVLCLSTAVNANVPAMPASGDNAVISASYGQLPIAFETNAGQADPNIRYFARGQGYMLLMTPQEFVLRMSSYDKAADKVNTAAVRLTFVNTNPDANAMTAIGRLPGTSNYFIGSNAQTWRTNVPTYEKVKYTGLYRGVDLVVYGNQRQIEYDFVVAPHADYKQIALKVKGAKCLTVDKDGSLIIASKGGKMLMHKPLVYQETDGKRQELKCRYKLKKGNLVSFQLSRYDKDKALVIDPTLSYSTYLGGSGSDYSWGIAVDSSGSAYVVGTTISTDFPVTNGAFQTTSKAGVYGTAFISKLNPAGTALEYSTYLGGAGASNGIGMGGDSATAIAVDSSGSAYVAGYTASTDFPVTSGAYQPSRKGSYDAFVTKLNSTGTALVYSTYVGGSGADYCYSIAIDSSGSAYVTGFTASTDFPVTSGAYQTALKGSDSVFITKLNATGTALVYSTYLGGNLYNDAYGIAVDSAGNAYIAGMTDSSDFPVTSGAFQTSLKAGRSGNGFITKLNATGTALVYSTFLGGSTADNCRGIAVDSSGSAYVVGRTASTDFPVTSGAYQTAMKGSYDIFVSKLNTTGAALVYSTYLGGSGVDYGVGIAIDSTGSAYVTGETASTDFPLTSDAYQTSRKGSYNAFVSKLNTTGAALVYSTYLGGSNIDYGGTGIAVDASKNAYVTGETASTDFPITSGAFQTSLKNSDGTAFVAKLQLPQPPSSSYILTVSVSGSGTVTSSPSGISCGSTCSASYTSGTSVTLTAAASSGYAFTSWSGCDMTSGSQCTVSMSANKSVTATFTSSGASSDNTTAAASFDAIYSQYASWFGSTGGSIQTGTSWIAYYQLYTNGAYIVAGTDGSMYVYYGGQLYSLGLNWQTLGKAAAKMSSLYAQYASWFGSKSGGIQAGTSGSSTYYVQWFSNGAALVAWTDGLMYTYYNGTSYALGVNWK